MNQVPKQPRGVQEWIILALCLGFGGHIALGLLLHSPDRWPVGTAGSYGMLFAGLLYIVAQLARSLWRIFISRREAVKEL
ncbi:MAG: hypothetical protein GKS05_07895 [Nitrospirales bacterium]|nr:hypothetical protein [Nitrospirales bacterium]